MKVEYKWLNFRKSGPNFKIREEIRRTKEFGRQKGICFLLLELTPKKCPFLYRGLECKSRKSRNTWSKRQIWPWSTEWSRAKANRVLPRERTGQSKHPLPPTQEKTLHMDITRWSTPKSDWLYSLQPKMEKLYTVSKKEDWELTVAQIMNSLLPNSDLNWRKWGKPLDHWGMT